MKADLHIHTTFSDGELEPQQAADLAKEAGLDLFAITDHDECRGFGKMKSTADITAIAGIELAAQYEGEVHVLGLCIDCSNELLLKHVGKASKSRENRALEMLEKLRRDDINISMADIQAECRGGVIGRPHMAAALVRKGYVASVAEAFDKYLSSRTPYYVPQRKISVSDAAALVQQAGGLPILAHPGLLKGTQLEALEPQLKDMGFWGIEAYHPAHTDGQCIEYESVARRQGLFVTTGSDYHGSCTPKVGIGGETRGGRYLVQSLKVLKYENEKRNIYMAGRY